MKNPKQLLKALEKLGYRLESSRSGSSMVKIYPPDTTLPFYTAHMGDTFAHPLRRFAKKNWNLDIETI
jgi:hypothetical protein